ncbi:isoprenylcysteine carboxylmethyltransferase family protein [Tolypothrix tenuis]
MHEILPYLPYKISDRTPISQISACDFSWFHKVNKDFMMTTETNKLTAYHFIYATFYILLVPGLVILISGDWLWIEGWIFAIWFLVLSLTTMIYLYRQDPGLLLERFKPPGSDNQKTWDKYFLYAIQILFWVWLVVMPLDAKRYAWSANFPSWLKVVGGIELLISLFFLYRSFTDNSFLSPLVRIQSEREHRVVSTGVYGFVRHPMYLGAIFLFIGTPLLLGSLYGVLIGVIFSLVLVARIFGEEKMLVEELPGYEDYQQKVKYRLIPFIW